MKSPKLKVLFNAGVVAIACVASACSSIPDEKVTAAALDATADEEDENIGEQKKKRSWAVVPIPVSSPTFGTGLVLGGAYFWPQTEEQRKTQPASVTGAAGAYTDNKSSAYGIAHQAYLSEDKWRISGRAQLSFIGGPCLLGC